LYFIENIPEKRLLEDINQSSQIKYPSSSVVARPLFDLNENPQGEDY